MFLATHRLSSGA